MLGNISFGGLTSGLDTTAIVQGLVALRRRPVLQLQQQKDDLNAQLSLIDDLKAKLEALGSTLEKLDTRNEFVARNAVSANETLFTATAGSTASLASYSIHISQLAQAQRDVSQGYAATTDAVGTGTVSITVTGQTTAIQIGTAENSLTGLKDAINAAGLGVTASILNDGSATPYRLVLTADQTGAANGFSVDVSGLSGGTVPALTTVATATDALLTVDTIAITSASNSVAGAIEGVTLELKAPSPDANTTQLTIGADGTALKDGLKQFVDAYNVVFQVLNDQSAQGALLNGNSIIRTLQSRLGSTLIGSVATGGTFSILAEAGLSTDREGLLQLDSTKLDAALSQDFDSVVRLFVSENGVDGIAAQLVSVIDDLTDFSDGIFKIRKDGIDRALRNLDDRIERGERSVAVYEETLNQKFTAMEMLLSTLQAQSGFLLSSGFLSQRS